MKSTTDALVEAAQAVVARWDSPKWKEEAPTADAINTLRTALAQPPSAEVPAGQIDAAAKVLAERMDYPWEHMPHPGREHMRETARKVIDAALKDTP